MQARLTTKPQHEVIAAIQSLDLEPVKLRMMDAELGEGWTQEYADSIEVAYKTFLIMLVKFPDDAEDILVSKDVDEFWHNHILHTLKYAEDCQKVFGNFLHHNPQPVARSVADLQKRRESAEKTCALRQLLSKDLNSLAYCNATAQPAYCNATVRGDKAAYCNAAISAETAYCNATIERAAYCNATAQPAYCNASVGAKQAAYCNASVRAAESAYCNATVEKAAAYCNAAAERGKAYCNASLMADKAAYCNATVGNSATS
jgi:hypothetical protein